MSRRWFATSATQKLDDQARDLYHQLRRRKRWPRRADDLRSGHELNNPLATILSWAERLRSGLDDNSRRGVEVILAESERAARIVRNLLTFARKRQSTRAMIDVNHVVRETLPCALTSRLTNIEVFTALAAGLRRYLPTPTKSTGTPDLVINAEQAMVSANGRGSLVIVRGTTRSATPWSRGD